LRSPDRVKLEQWLRWVRARPWPVWAAAGAVFLVFALVGALTRGPATVPVAAHSLFDGLERGSGSSAAPQPSAIPEPGPPQHPGLAYPSGAPAPPASASAPAPTASAYFANCAAAEAAGAAPISRGQPGYRPELDRDGDGVACDPDGQPSSSPTTPAASPTPTLTTTPTAPAPTTTSPAPTPTATPAPTVTSPPGLS
jgi:Excalibur calcium-binding domain